MPEIIALFGTWQIRWIVILMAIDVVLGIVGAILKKEFRLGRLGDFMKKGAIGYILGFAVLEAVAQANPSLAGLVLIAFVLVVLSLVGSILNNLGKIGVPLPAWLKRD